MNRGSGNLQTGKDLPAPWAFNRPRSTLVTGASGFVGTALLDALRRRGCLVLGVVRRLEVPRADIAVVHSIDGRTDWRPIINGVGVVIHLAARVHLTEDSASDPLAEFRRVNVDGSLNLAYQAARAGVKRFVFISSIKVNGEETTEGLSYTADDIARPSDPYAISKYEAEVGLRRLAEETGMAVVIIRPVVVYGPGVKANFLAMMRWLHYGIPLPLGAIKNSRSLVALDNLVDLIATCLHHPAAANQTFLVSDGEDLSTTELLRHTAAAMGKTARLIPVPSPILELSARLLGKPHIAQRLCRSLQVDITKTRELLGWVPPVTVDQGLQKAAEHFVQHRVR